MAADADDQLEAVMTDEDQSPETDIEDDPEGVESTPDGGAIVSVGPDEDEPDADKHDETDPSIFYRNLLLDHSAFKDDVGLADRIAQDLLEQIRQDREDRKKRDEDLADALARTGMSGAPPGGAEFDGANRVTHPLVLKSNIEYGASAIKELLPPDGPVRSFLPGTPTEARLQKAERKVRLFNYQLTQKMTEFRTQMEQMLNQLGMGGSQYIRLVWNPRLRRPHASFVSVDTVFIPYAATDFYSADRRTWMDTLTELEFQRRVSEDIYADVSVVPDIINIDETKTQEEQKSIEGASQSGLNPDGTLTVFETSTFLEFEGRLLPYVVSLSNNAEKLLSVVRNWEMDDKTEQPMDWLIEFQFIPWDGPIGIGFPQLIGSLSIAATGALRALLDSAHFNNFPSALVLKGANVSGQNKQTQPGTLMTIDGGSAADDIRKVVMEMPFNEPSNVLYQLLGFLVSAGEDMIRTTFEKLSDTPAQQPVGTTMALIEQGTKVVTAINTRLHASMARLLKVLHRIDKMYMDESEIKDEAGEVLAYKSDLEGPMDVIPVSDPNIFSEMQRMAQVQAVAGRSAALPDLYNQRAVELMLLKRLKVPNPESLLKPQPTPEEMNAVNENVALTMGRPVVAFPEQDHLAHIEVLLNYMTSPVLGMLPIIAPTFIPGALDHLKEHIVLWWADRIYQIGSQAANKPLEHFQQYKDPKTGKELDKLLAAASKTATADAVQAFKGIPPAIQQAQALLKQFQPQMGVDPNTQATLADKEKDRQARGEETKLMADTQTKGKVIDLQKARESNQAQGQRQTAKESNDLQVEQVQQTAEDQRTAAEIQSKETMNTEDNETAMAIAAQEIATGERTHVKDGHSLGKDPGG